MTAFLVAQIALKNLKAKYFQLLKETCDDKKATMRAAVKLFRMSMVSGKLSSLFMHLYFSKTLSQALEAGRSYHDQRVKERTRMKGYEGRGSLAWKRRKQRREARREQKLQQQHQLETASFLPRPTVKKAAKQGGRHAGSGVQNEVADALRSLGVQVDPPVEETAGVATSRSVRGGQLAQDDEWDAMALAEEEADVKLDLELGNTTPAAAASKRALMKKKSSKYLLRKGQAGHPMDQQLDSLASEHGLTMFNPQESQHIARQHPNEYELSSDSGSDYEEVMDDPSFNPAAMSAEEYKQLQAKRAQRHKAVLERVRRRQYREEEEEYWRLIERMKREVEQRVYLRCFQTWEQLMRGRRRQVQEAKVILQRVARQVFKYDREMWQGDRMYLYFHMWHRLTRFLRNKRNKLGAPKFTTRIRQWDRFLQLVEERRKRAVRAEKLAPRNLLRRVIVKWKSLHWYRLARKQLHRDIIITYNFKLLQSVIKEWKAASYFRRRVLLDGPRLMRRWRKGVQAVKHRRALGEQITAARKQRVVQEFWRKWRLERHVQHVLRTAMIARIMSPHNFTTGLLAMYRWLGFRDQEVVINCFRNWARGVRGRRLWRQVLFSYRRDSATFLQRTVFVAWRGWFMRRRGREVEAAAYEQESGCSEALGRANLVLPFDIRQYRRRIARVRAGKHLEKLFDLRVLKHLLLDPPDGGTPEAVLKAKEEAEAAAKAAGSGEVSMQEVIEGDTALKRQKSMWQGIRRASVAVAMVYPPLQSQGSQRSTASDDFNIFDDAMGRGASRGSSRHGAETNRSAAVRHWTPLHEAADIGEISEVRPLLRYCAVCRVFITFLLVGSYASSIGSPAADRRR